MGGGLLQLVAYGSQDIYLTGNPQITFFKVIYRRHTNFSMECVKQTITGVDTITTSSGSKGSVIISRNGDLLHQLWLKTDSTADFLEGPIAQRGSIRGDSIIEEAIIEIGGQRIDRHTKEWNQVWAELTTPVSKCDAYKYLTGGFSSKFNVNESAPALSTRIQIGTRQQSIMVPFNFWFCRDIGLALPLIALQYHDVELKLTFGTGSSTGNISRTGLSDILPTVEIWADFIYLDTDERRRFSQVSHEYLIEQLQVQEEGSAVNDIKLNFDHPVKELIWTSEPEISYTAPESPYISSSGDITTYPITTQKARLEFNGHDRFTEQTREYFQIKQPMVHHTSVPGYNIKEYEPAKFFPPRSIFRKHTTANSLTASRAGIPSGTTEGVMGAFSIESGVNLLNFTVNILRITTTKIIDIKVGDILSISYIVQDEGGNNHSLNVIVQISKVSTFLDDGSTYGPTHQFELSTHNSNEGTDLVDTETDGLLIPNSVAGPGSIYKIGSTYCPMSRCSSLKCDINVYSFAIHPEDHQPSGTCNFSKIDHAKLIFSSVASIKNIYAVNYNVLRIMSGMGGLAYSG